MDDFYILAARQRMAQLEAGRSRALADLAESRAASDYEAAATSVQQIADIDAQAAALQQLHGRYVESQTPRPAPPQSREEWAVKPVARMTPDDGLQIARQSKHGANLTWEDPNVRAGWAEAQARRGRGE